MYGVTQSEQFAVRRGGTTTRIVLGRSGGARAPVAENGQATAPARDPLASAAGYRSHGAECWAVRDVSGALTQWSLALSAVNDVRGRVPDAHANAEEKLARSNLAQGCLELQRFDEALSHAEAAAELQPECPKTRYRLASALIGLGRWVAAEVALAELEALGHATSAAQGRANLRIKRRAAREVERSMAAKMIGSDADWKDFGNRSIPVGSAPLSALQPAANSESASAGVAVCDMEAMD